MANTSNASQIVFGTIVSSIKEAMQVSTDKVVAEGSSSSKNKDFSPFIVGGSTKDNPIAIVEVKNGDREITNN